MIVMLARKQYIYQYMEEMLTDVKFVDVGDNVRSFVNLAEKLDYLIVAEDVVAANEKICPVLSIEEFADLYFEIEKSSNPDSDLVHRCNLIRDFLNTHPSR